MESGRIKTLDQEIKKLKESVDRMHALLGQERVSYNIIESQFEQLKTRNAEWAKKNADAEESFNKMVAASNGVSQTMKAEEDKVRGAIMTLWMKGNQKFKEVEASLEKADKRLVERHLKDLEALAS